jgi:hypothetical protein
LLPRFETLAIPKKNMAAALSPPAVPLPNVTFDGNSFREERTAHPEKQLFYGMNSEKD